MSDYLSGRHVSVAFLLTQVGSGAAKKFAKALEPLQFAPSDAGILRLLVRSPGISQRELATRLDMHASRLVGVIDGLEKRGLVTREANAEDRRVYSLHLSAAGHEALAAIGAVARAHNEEICSGLTDAERAQLGAVLLKVADRLGLQQGIHPGYSDLGRLGADSSSGRSDDQLVRHK
jgi:DNA-binding MarR family transcriptional regulator